jgi:hypothetical protein
MNTKASKIYTRSYKETIKSIPKKLYRSLFRSQNDHTKKKIYIVEENDLEFGSWNLAIYLKVRVINSTKVAERMFEMDLPVGIATMVFMNKGDSLSSKK